MSTTATSMSTTGTGIAGEGRSDPDPTVVPGLCACGGQTWPMDGGWQCEDCGRIYTPQHNGEAVTPTDDLLAAMPLDHPGWTRLLADVVGGA